MRYNHSIDCENNDQFYHRVSKIDIHPLYDQQTDDHDIAILTLQKPFVFGYNPSNGYYIQPIPYAYPGYKGKLTNKGL